MKLASLLTTASLLVGTAVSAMDYKEAPSLKEMVSKGEIPPIEQRLPKTPFVVENTVCGKKHPFVSFPARVPV